jgi:3-oxoacyl-[acyl-carrier-protein] synthase II
VSADTRVVITGMGAVTPLGKDVGETWRSLIAGRSAARRIRAFDPSEFLTQIACEIDDFDPQEWVDKKDARRLDRSIQMAVVAAGQALRQSGLRPEGEAADDVGVIIGTGIGGLNSVDEAYRVLFDKGPKRVNPMTAVNMLPDMSSGQVAIRFGLRGPNFCVISACATGSNVIGEAAEIIKRGDATAMVAGGVESGVVPFGLAAFHRTGSLSTRNDDPEHASRPFDAKRDGFVFSEGSGVVVLERADAALARGATPLAELVGYGATADAYHVSAPDESGSGASRAMSRALRKAGIGPEQISYINAHGTSTPLNDKMETIAIKRVFGDHAYRVPISSTKSMVGHLLGAAGAVEAIVSVCTIQEGMIHPTINYEFPDPDCDLDYVPNTPRRAKVEYVLSNSFGFGGHNASLILKAWRPDGVPSG